MYVARRLNQIAKDLNVGLSVIVNFLAEKGYVIENKPTTKLSPEQVETLLNAFENTGDISYYKIDPEILSNKKMGLSKNNKLSSVERIEEIRREKGVPKTVFKYFGTQNYSLDCLRHKYLYYSSPQDFNDPFDCHTCLVSFKTSKSRYNDEQISRFRKRAKSLGVCCYSRRKDSMLMWSHYADKHKGFCVEFNNSNKQGRVAPLDVNYVDEFISADFRANAEDAIFNLIYTKSLDWSYEEEMRQIASSLITPQDRKIKLHDDDLKAIYFGVNCEDKVKKEIISIIKDNYNNQVEVELYQAYIKENEFKIEFTKVNSV
ncbi:DUF2971 domain-containing protein [Hymenobacter sp. BT507]|uniref:DUF2971 domain-containing protein n=1 Tax=Hymenobacter citatus TaxID=2763506 RepID=A0ABR7MGF7_9BACT|nr:DUF2971 domain-containing protein [Hymenobacter citatus]MBC6609820.1 DUF2971 domain-containing protein [Hymenobacter citatus]